jgi:hypothetical protein
MPLLGPFCSHCGERRRASGDLSFRHFFEHTLETFTHVDGKIFGTLKALLFRPGVLTTDYLLGRRKPYIAPLQLFLIANLIFFLLHPLVPSAAFTTPLHIQRQERPFSPLVQAMVDRKLAASGMTYEQFETQFDIRAETEAKSLVIILVPMVSLFVALLYLRQRRHFLEHVVFSLHFCAFYILWILFLLCLSRPVLALLKLGGTAPSHLTYERAVSVFSLIICGIYFHCAARRFYGGPAWKTVFKTIAFALMMYPMLLVYRFILFLVDYGMT